MKPVPTSCQVAAAAAAHPVQRFPTDATSFIAKGKAHKRRDQSWKRKKK
jgi:hypothetical protein